MKTCAIYYEQNLSGTDEKVLAATLDDLIRKKAIDTVYVRNLKERNTVIEWMRQKYPQITVDKETVCREADYVLVYGMVTSNIHARVQFFRIGI